MTDQELEDFVDSAMEQQYAFALIGVIQNTPGGVTVYTPAINDLCRDIYDETGVMVSPKRLTDTWEFENPYGGTWSGTRNNSRKHLLTIKS